MKKVIAFMTIAVCFAATSAMAQGGGGQMTPEQRAAMLKERLKPVGLSEVQADSVVAVWGDRELQRSVYNGANPREMSQEDRQAKTKELNEARSKRLSKAGLSDDQIKKVIEALSFRPGGGRPGGGGGRK